MKLRFFRQRQKSPDANQFRKDAEQSLLGQLGRRLAAVKTEALAGLPPEIAEIVAETFKDVEAETRKNIHEKLYNG
jgi:hypothetical protein